MELKERIQKFLSEKRKLNEAKDVTDYVADKKGKKFYIDNEDIDTGDPIFDDAELGDEVKFKYKGKVYNGQITDYKGRDNDVVEITID